MKKIIDTAVCSKYFRDNDNNVLRFDVVPDENPESPREWDNVGTMVCWHRNYNLGDKHNFDEPSDFECWLGEQGENIVILPLYLLDHSGLSISTGSFGDPWDSGQVGYIYVTKEKALYEYGNINNENWKEVATKHLQGEVKEYDTYLKGYVYGYIVENKYGKEEDSCYGYIIDEYDDEKILMELLQESGFYYYNIKLCDKAEDVEKTLENKVFMKLYNEEVGYLNERDSIDLNNNISFNRLRAYFTTQVELDKLNIEDEEVDNILLYIYSKIRPEIQEKIPYEDFEGFICEYFF